jgi:hypothetical protein
MLWIYMQVFEAAVAPGVAGCLDGTNFSALCYGQSGTGKSHTALGGPDDAVRHTFTTQEGERERQRDQLLGAVLRPVRDGQEPHGAGRPGRRGATHIQPGLLGSFLW